MMKMMVGNVINFMLINGKKYKYGIVGCLRVVEIV